MLSNNELTDSLQEPETQADNLAPINPGHVDKPVG
jgi:hypothetical protein